MMHRSDEEIIISLGRLRRRGGIVSQDVGGDLCFEHSLLRDYIYRDLSAAELRSLHGRAASALIDDDSSSFAVIGEHLKAAGQPELALPYLLDAAQRDRILGDYRQASRRLQGVEPAASSSDAEPYYETLLGAEIGLGEMADALATLFAWRDVSGETSAQIAQHAELIHLLGRFRDARSLMQPLVEAGHPWATIRGLNYLRFYDPARADAEAAQLLVRKDWDESKWLLLRYVVGGPVTLLTSRLDEARALLEAVSFDAKRAGDEDLAAAATRRLVELQIHQGQADGLGELLGQARRSADLAGSRQAHYVALTRAEYLRASGQFDAALNSAEQARVNFERLGLPIWRAHATLSCAEASRANGHDEQALALAVDAAAQYAKMELVWGSWHAAVAQRLASGQALTRLADDAEAAGLLTEASWIEANPTPDHHPLMFP